MLGGKRVYLGHEGGHGGKAAAEPEVQPIQHSLEVGTEKGEL